MPERLPSRERDGLNTMLAEKLARAKLRLIDAARAPTCARCKQALPAEREGWMTARELIDVVYAASEWKYGDGSSISLALMALEDEGVFERRDDLKVRLKP